MIRKWYEITCDYCGGAMDHLPFKPSDECLKKDGVIIKRGKHFCCDECYTSWEEERKFNKKR